MIIDESTSTQPKIARLVTTRFLPPNDTDVEPDECSIVFYYYNLGIPSEVGHMKLIIVYVYCFSIYSFPRYGRRMCHFAFQPR